MSRSVLEIQLHERHLRDLASTGRPPAMPATRPLIWREPNPTGWCGLKASDRARPLTDLGLRLLGLHVATTTPKEN